MVKHVVMWKFKEVVNKNEKFEEMQKIFNKLNENVEEIKNLELIKGFQGYDACLITTHADEEGLAAYQIHPEHLKVKAFMAQIVEQRASCNAFI